MKIIYRTIDGVDFDNDVEAREHEAAIAENQVKMYAPSGARTYNPNDALAVFLIGGTAADVYRKICEQAHTNANGIEVGDEGLFVWDSFNATYRYVEIESYHALLAAIEDAFAEGYGNV